MEQKEAAYVGEMGVRLAPVTGLDLVGEGLSSLRPNLLETEVGDYISSVATHGPSDGEGEAVDSRGQGCRNIKFFSSARDSSP
jgi:hypothetical protein